MWKWRQTYHHHKPRHGYPPKPGHYVSSITYREHLTTLPGSSQGAQLEVDTLHSPLDAIQKR
jgi:hypothetical protein